MHARNSQPERLEVAASGNHPKPKLAPGQVKKDGSYGNHIEQVINGLEDYKKNNARRTNKILIHVHGGLNLQTGSVERAAELYQDILKNGSYPIFINWQSSLFTSYWNHLTHIRQGEDWHEGTLSRIGGYLTAPLYFTADLARAAIRLPTATFFQVRNDMETVPQLRSLHSVDLVLAQETMLKELCRRRLVRDDRTVDEEVAQKVLDEQIAEYMRALDRSNTDCPKVESSKEQDLSNLSIWLGLDERTGLEKFEASLKYLITSPTKLASAPIIDALGTSSWDTMLRSVSQLFHYDGRQVSHTDLDPSLKNEHDFKQTGALSFFLGKLRTKICNNSDLPKQPSSQSEECSNSDNWEITLVGHSTGAIIINRIIREFGDLPIKNIVYMAAASTIKDYQDTIFPYLAKKNAESIKQNTQTTKKNAETSSPKPAEFCDTSKTSDENRVCVYHLMLHEAAESGEWWKDFIDPFPRGSLLVWLDSFLSHPLSREDRTLGRFTNFIAAAHHTPQPLRPYISIVKFGVGEGVLNPQKHGEFGGKLEFWKPECWGPPADNPRNCYRGTGHY